MSPAKEVKSIKVTTQGFFPNLITERYKSLMELEASSSWWGQTSLLRRMCKILVTSRMWITGTYQENNLTQNGGKFGPVQWNPIRLKLINSAICNFHIIWTEDAFIFKAYNCLGFSLGTRNPAVIKNRWQGVDCVCLTEWGSCSGKGGHHFSSIWVLFGISWPFNKWLWRAHFPPIL